jgi:hypothetical protein
MVTVLADVLHYDRVLPAHYTNGRWKTQRKKMRLARFPWVAQENEKPAPGSELRASG